jgi:hypothetical protein
VVAVLKAQQEGKAGKLCDRLMPTRLSPTFRRSVFPFPYGRPVRGRPLSPSLTYPDAKVKARESPSSIPSERVHESSEYL